MARAEIVGVCAYEMRILVCGMVGLLSACVSVQDPAEPNNEVSSPATGVENASDEDSCEPMACSPVTPTDALIVDFADVREDGVFVDTDSWQERASDWWLRFYGSPYVYPEGPDALTQSTDGEWHIEGTVSDWSGFGLWFGACSVDLSAYQGFSFDVSGDVGPEGELRLFINTGPNEPPEQCRIGVGSCDPEAGACRQPVATLSVADAGTQTVRVMFDDATDGAPSKTPDPGDILQFHFGFAWTDYEGERSDPYPVDVTLDNFELLP